MFEHRLMRWAILQTHRASVDKSFREMFAFNMIPDISPGFVAETIANTTGHVARSRIFHNIFHQISGVKA